MPKRTVKARTARPGERARATAGIPPSVVDPNDEVAWQDHTYIQQLVQELCEGRPAARLLKAASRDHKVPASQTEGIIAHELRQPLFAIAMASENLRLLLENDDLDRDRMLSSVNRMAEQAERAQAIIDQTLLSATRAAQVQTTDVADSVRKVVDLLDNLVADRDIELACQLPEEQMLAPLSAIELEQVFVNLIRNAVDSIGDRRSGGWSGRGMIMITVQRSAGDQQFTVSDNGVGLPNHGADAMFRPFFTTKASGGTGLGLHICREIVGRAAGSIHARSAPKGGAEFVIRMPLVSN